MSEICGWVTAETSGDELFSEWLESNADTPSELAEYDTTVAQETNLIELATSEASDVPEPNLLPTSATNDAPAYIISTDAIVAPESNLFPDRISCEVITAQTAVVPETGLFSTLPIKGPKPPLPYREGWMFRVQSHSTNESVNVGQDWAKGDFLSPEALKEYEKHDVLELCQVRPPAKGVYGNTFLDLQISKLVSVGDYCRTQLFTVALCGSDIEQRYAEWNLAPQTPLMARVYDPVYFDDAGGYLDRFNCADHLYTYESGSYSHLKEIQGSAIPRFCGSYSFRILSRMPSVNSRLVSREVRMILLEVVEGTKMSNLDVLMYSSLERQEIMRQVMDTECQLYQRDVPLLNLEPRNVVVDFKKGSLKVLIDLSNVFDHRDQYLAFVNKKFLFHGQYISPLIHWNLIPTKFFHWIDWEWRVWLEEEFGHTTDTISEEMLDCWS